MQIIENEDRDANGVLSKFHINIRANRIVITSNIEQIIYECFFIQNTFGRVVSLVSKCILNIYINLFPHRKCNSYHIFPKSLTEAVPPVLPPVLDHLILGGQHGAVADGELPEPLPLPHLRRVVAEHWT